MTFKCAFDEALPRGLTKSHLYTAASFKDTQGRQILAVPFSVSKEILTSWSPSTKGLSSLNHATEATGELTTVHSRVTELPSTTEDSFKGEVISGQPKKEKKQINEKCFYPVSEFIIEYKES